MDITVLYNKIIETMNEAGYQQVAADVEKLLAGASTGGEALSSTAGYLAGLQKNNPPAYACCKDLIGQYLRAAG
jgi:hypothetical protein